MAIEKLDYTYSPQGGQETTIWVDDCLYSVTNSRIPFRAARVLTKYRALMNEANRWNV